MLKPKDILEPINAEAVRQVKLPKEVLLDVVIECFKVLGDRTRAKILYAVQKQPLCVRDLTIVVGISESGISHQLNELKDKHLVRAKRQGNVIYYSIAYQHLHNLLQEAEYYADHVKQNIPDHPKEK